MSTTPPEADTQYSRGSRRSRDLSGRSRQRHDGPARADATGPRRGVYTGILLGGVLGAALLLVAEFTTLFTVTTSASGSPIKTVSAGSHHSYALIPIGLLALVLSVSVWRSGSRPALLAIGLLGVIALVIALVGDLPDAHATGLVLRAGHYLQASSSASTGLYLETLGGVLLLITSVCGLLLVGWPARPTPARTPTSAGADPL